MNKWLLNERETELVFPSRFFYILDNSELINSSGAKVDTYAITYNGLNQVQKVKEKLNGTVQNTTSTYDPM
ncbi:hypothetical protein [Melghirimyces algeriensis]|uniref:hypothetical protein n=1 Tax=Melghirimyces algeriensis TaxID=910412 RepID=UPI00163D8040|nr:hypothetical protein [Melghirimyces algeriensis]